MDFFSTGIFAIALGVALFGATHIIRKKKSHLNYYLAAALFSLSYILFYFWLVRTNMIGYIPILVYSDIYATFFVAPSIYLSFYSIILEKKGPVKSYKIHYVLPLVMTACFLVYNTVKYSQIPDLLNSQFDHYRTPIILLSSILSDLSLTGYITAAIIQAYIMQKKREVTRKKEFRVVLFFLFFLLMFSLFLLFSYFTKLDDNLIIITGVFGLFVLAYSVICFRIPEYSQGQLQRKSTRQALLTEAEQNYHLERLNKLMIEDEIFRNQELSLTLLAEKLNLSANAFSQLINCKTGMNFRQYLSSFRIANVKKELASGADKSILEIAFDNGFNSKSSFNMLFRENEGISPREYRNQLQLKGYQKKHKCGT